MDTYVLLIFTKVAIISFYNNNCLINWTINCTAQLKFYLHIFVRYVF